MPKAHRASALALLLAAAACTTTPRQAVDPNAWPAVQSRVPRDARMEARIDAMLSEMSVEEKVAQIVQPDISSITPEEYRQYRFGSILAGGNSSPGGNERAPAREWLALADRFWEASMSGPRDRIRIPVMFGIDAVHGHANIIGATIFPQNIGLGATRNPDLIRRIGEVTAREMVVTGIDWDFSPTLAVVRDDRWGRAYEGFSEDPEIVRSFAGAMVEGLQGRPGTAEFMGAGRVIATAKHFVGDGGTAGGRDQGDNPSTPQQLRDIHGAGYPPAIEAGVQAIMASFSRVRGEKVHGSRDLLTGIIREQLGFDGLVVGDWNAHGQVEGCTNTSCPQSINAGLDMFMAPDSWRELYANSVAQVRSGQIPMARLDEAVRRILRVKIRAGLFERGRPSSREFAGQFALLGAADHRAVARQAVRESLVLLKNASRVLPLRPSANVLVAGDGADNIPKQAGGWTITWQGSGVTNEDFPNAQSIWSGIQETVRAGGGRATLSPEGRWSGQRPDAAIVVFGEEPYAEFVGDRQTLEFSPADRRHLELMQRLRSEGIPVVAVFLSGRPMWVNPELNASDAFVAAFLPGSEGGGIADVLFANRDGTVRNDFRGRLSYSWPRRADQTPLNRGDADYDPLFAYGYGLRYADAGDLPRLSEERPIGAAAGADGVLFGRGALPVGWSLGLLEEGGVAVPVTGNAGQTGTARLRVAGVDRRAQEDARTFIWNGSGGASARIEAGQPLDISREATGQLSLVFEYRVDTRPTAPVFLGMQAAQLPIGGALRAAPLGEWQTLAVPLGCFARAGVDMQRVSVPFTLATAGRLALSISDVRIASATVPQDRCGQPSGGGDVRASVRGASIVGDRAPVFWGACAAIAIGVLLHLPMLAMAHEMGNHLVGMPMDPGMWFGMVFIVLGVPAAIYGALPKHRAPHGADAGTSYEAPDTTPLGRWHAAVLLVLILGLVIDVMKPATLGFVLPGMSSEYGISRATVAWFPFVALVGTTVGSFVWGWLADIYGRRVSILLSTILFVATSICGAMPAFELNLLMCFLMGSSAGGMLPVVYTLLAEVMPPKHRSWVLVLVGGTGLVGGYLAASAAAHAFEPIFGWRVLWLQGFPTGMLLLLLARFIPESPRFLAEQGRTQEIEEMRRKYGIEPRPRQPVPPDAEVAQQRHGRLTLALVISALSWSFVNFGLLLWLPSDLQARGYSSELASGILASSALLALPTIMVAAWLYARWSSKWTFVGTILVTLVGLIGALLPAHVLSWPPLLVAVIAMLIVGSNGMIAVLLPYAAENYPLGVRGRATGLVAGASKFGGVAVQGFALVGLIPTLGGAALALLVPMGASVGLVAWAGRETRGRSLRELEAHG